MALTVVYAIGTGHVVGALDLTGAGGTPPGPETLVGRELPLRVSLGGGRTATLPLNARELAVASVDDEPGVLADPLAFGVELSPEGKPKPTLLRLPAWTGDGGIALAADGVTLTVKVPVPRAAKAVVLVSDDQETHVLAGEIPAQHREVTLPLTLTSGGTHGVLALVAGWAGRLEKEAVT
ncbi:hypothetical protein E2C00_19665 [Streptomyces sp. WAC05374]|uniref:hypothetical protein n=1 Tax=Streptomyces sp. WAC05374 TaxID=2487420 RepID=UPI000F86E8E2|nr:hypothetical protein [Streptomyces sp. WAC05374]RST10119.1 hypothetical protein EF905_28010 [Streptomyces sp. WAC05374]TDF37918.1 hypothetical protein E2B92_28870 [Streptomyces sp. WAC05374]TDF52774.1 hypothetical protein E2C02_21135 [Streptomyces sp. WAC05374]TDF54193.1 hypothetical protein E2C00_19665 [Streptomyces sp. WAC05374]